MIGFRSVILFICCILSAEGKLLSDYTKLLLEPIRSLVGVQVNDPFRIFMPQKRVDSARRIPIPSAFDSRTNWPFCPTIAEISTQGGCASCWAVTATDVMSDRICIHSHGSKIVRISAGNLLSCCRMCGKGCQSGGFPSAAWYYWKKRGIVTGGPYSSYDGCQPYQLFPCQQYHPVRSCPSTEETPKCSLKCNSNYSTSYERDLYYGESIYKVPNDIEAIQIEIMTNGPVQALLRIYEDLLTHKSGIYQHLHGKGLEYHAVRIIGWGEENQVGYWLAANVWSRQWGENGFFKILRGSNTAEIESHIMAGIPVAFNQKTRRSPFLK